MLNKPKKKRRKCEAEPNQCQSTTTVRGPISIGDFVSAAGIVSPEYNGNVKKAKKNDKEDGEEGE